MPDRSDENELESYRLVGKFMHSFALMEQSLNLGIGKLLNLEAARNDIVCSNIAFYKKTEVLFSAESLLASKPNDDRKKFLDKTRSEILELNNKRNMFAHCPFYAVKGGIDFRRVVTNTKLNVRIVTVSGIEVEALCQKAINLANDIDRLVEDLQPFVPSLDYSDPRNSCYFALFEEF